MMSACSSLGSKSIIAFLPGWASRRTDDRALRDALARSRDGVGRASFGATRFGGSGNPAYQLASGLASRACGPGRQTVRTHVQDLRRTRAGTVKRGQSYPVDPGIRIRSIPATIRCALVVCSAIYSAPNPILASSRTSAFDPGVHATRAPNSAIGRSRQFVSCVERPRLVYARIARIAGADARLDARVPDRFHF